MFCSHCGGESPTGKRFCGDCGTALISPAHAPTDPTRSVSAAARKLRVSAVERRSITIMFCDLVDSTRLSTRMDPEDFRNVIAACHQRISECVVRYGGFIARYVGDAAMVFFGYPQPHEDDAERAIRTGLAATAAVAALRVDVPGYQPQIRVGIATGLTVVGDLLGSGTDVAGETPNLAARLHTLAGPGEVLIDATTHRLAGARFAYCARGAMPLKGFDAPVEITAVTEAIGGEGRDPRATMRRRSPLLGRLEERALLRAAWNRARAGEGQVVLLTGEAGIGKSRLTAALEEDLAGERHGRLRYFCSPYHVTSALQPVVAQLERSAGFAPDDDAVTRMAKLGGFLAPSDLDPAHVAAMGDLLSLRRIEGMSPQARKDRVFAALLAQFRALLSRAPGLLLVEDAHWADPTSRELLDVTVEAARTLPVMVLVAARPEYQPSWSGQAHVTTIRLARLDRGAAGELIRRIARSKALPTRIAEEIVNRSDGVPLFIEEMTKAVLESDLLVEHDDRYDLSRPTGTVSIPETLNASLLARLGPPSVMRELALIGATIGREFSHEMLAAVSGHPEQVLNAALRSLIETELVFPRSRPPNATYSFKHALVRDAAYGLLLRDRKRELHGRIAEVMQERQAETVARQPELLAQHFAAAAMPEPALRQWTAAARRAGERWAMAEAAAHYEQALEMLAQLPITPATRKAERDLVLALGNVLIASHGYTAPRTGAVFDRARVVCEALDDTTNLIRVANGQWSYHLMRSEVDQARAVADDLLRRDSVAPSLELGLAGHRLLGASMLQEGRLGEAQAHLDRAATLLEQATAETVGARDASVAIPAYLSIVHGLRGQYAAARRQRATALERARASDNPYRLAFALGVATIWFNVVLDDGSELDDFDALTAERDFPFWRGFAVAHRGIAQARAGDIDGGLALVREGERIHRALGTLWGIPQSVGTIAQFLPPAEGLRLAGECLSELDATGVRWFAPELLRIRGELLARDGDLDGAEAALAAAGNEARAQGARHWELRVLLTQAGLRRHAGREREVAEALAGLCDALDDRAAPADLARARAVLAEMRVPCS